MNPTADGKTKRRRSREEDVERRKEAILRAATELFAENGFSDAITRALADRLGLGKGTSYRHFPSKRELFLAAADRATRKLHQRIMASVEGVEDGLEQMARGVLAFLTFFAARPQCVELLILERAPFKDRPRPAHLEHREGNVQLWRELYGGATFTNYFAGPAKPVAAQARDILDIVFQGALAPAGRQGLRDVSLPDGLHPDEATPQHLEV